MEQNQNNNRNSNKNLLILIIAIILLITCCLLSCCAGSIYTLTKTDTKSLLDTYTLEMNRNIGKSDTAKTDEIPAAGSGLSEISNSEIADETAEPASAAEETTEEITEPGELTKEQKEIIKRTEKVRGLHADKTLAPVYRTEDELRTYLTEEVYAEDMSDYERFYKILGFIPDDFDLKQFYIDLYAEQIAGYYDPEQDQMNLISGLSDEENNKTFVHEYTHYLQYHDPVTSKILLEARDEDFALNNGELLLVLDAITEGDATLVEMLTSSADDDGKGNSESGGSDVFDSAPKFMIDSMLFSYQYGFNFVWSVYMKGGFAAVNDLYTNVPASVEQIIHPEKYLKDDPVDIDMTPFRNQIEKSGEIILEDCLDEMDIVYTLSDAYDPKWRLSDRLTKSASEGWGGGSYIFADVDGSSLFFTKLVWDSVDDAREAETGFEQYCERRFGKAVSDHQWTGPEGEKVFLERQNDMLYWMILPKDFDEASLLDRIHNSVII